MSHLYDFFENHMEAWGALFFGLLTIAACVAIAVAINGSMWICSEAGSQSIPIESCDLGI